MNKSKSSNVDYVIALLITLALAVVSMMLNPVVNNDGVEYFAAANAIVEGDWAQALAKYKWPFYPAIIAVFIKLGFSQVVAAGIVNLILQCFCAAAFIRVFHQLDTPSNVLRWAFIFVIAAPALDNYRWMLVRDYGFLAAWLFGLSFVFQSMQQGKVAVWKIYSCFLIALFFRIEAILLILTMPIVLTHDERSFGRNIFYIIAITVLISFMSGLWLSHDGLREALKTGNIVGVLLEGWGKIIGTLETIRFRLNQYILGHELTHLATPIFFTSIFLMVLWSFVKLVQLPYLLLVFWSLKRYSAPFSKNIRSVLSYYFVLFIALMLIYAFLSYYSTGRYALASWSIVALFIPYAIENIWQWAKSHSDKRALYLVYLLLAIGVLYIARTSFEKSNRLYLKDAGVWIKENISNESRIFTGNRIVVFYSERPRNVTKIYEPYDAFIFASDRAVWTKYDYIVAEIHGSPDGDMMQKFSGFYKSEPFKTFTNGHNTIAIYDVSKAKRD